MPTQKLQEVLDWARRHGEDSEPEHEVGDLQELVDELWGLLTESQQRTWALTSSILETLHEQYGQE